MNLQIKQLGKYAAIAFLIVLCVLFYGVKKGNAITQTNFTGSCGILANFNYNGWNNLAASAGHQPNTLTKNAIGTINFDTGRINIEQAVITNYESAVTVSETSVKTGGTFVFTSFDRDTGIYKYTTTIDGTGQVILLSVVPVNSGNSYLISGQVPALDQAAGPSVSGVCQKV